MSNRQVVGTFNDTAKLITNKTSTVSIRSLFTKEVIITAFVKFIKPFHISKILLVKTYDEYETIFNNHMCTDDYY